MAHSRILMALASIGMIALVPGLGMSGASEEDAGPYDVQDEAAAPKPGNGTHQVHRFEGLVSGVAWHVAPAPVGCQEDTCGSWPEAVAMWMEFEPVVETIVVEMSYAPHTPAAALGLFIQCRPNDPDTPCAFRAGPEPYQQIRIDREEAEALGHSLDVPWGLAVESRPALGTAALVGIDAGIAYQEAVRLAISVFWGAPAPEDHRVLD